MARRAHSYSPQTRDAVTVLGSEVARARRARSMTAAELAERAGIGRTTLHMVERGEPTVAIGIVFELATLVGIDLFDTGPADMPALLSRATDRLAAQPGRVRTSEPDDDF